MVTFGGKTADEALIEYMMQQHAEQYGSATPADPLASPRDLRQQYSKKQLLGILGDYTLWVEQLMDEMAVLARKNWRLKQKLKDPSLSKGKARAMQRSRDQDEQIIQYASDIAMLEAWCDRYWRALPRSVRAKYAMDWSTAPESKRLIGQAWRHIAARFNWPDYFTISAHHFRRIPYSLQQDIIASGITTEGIPLGKDHEWDTPGEISSDHHDHRTYTYYGKERNYTKWYTALSVPDEARQRHAIPLPG